MNPVTYRLFLLKKLPLVYITGIRITALTPGSCTTVARHSWINQNPFRSMYFAVMQMAAELSTGALCMANIQDTGGHTSMLVVKTEGSYHRKVTGRAHFTCKDGDAIRKAILEAKETGEPRTVDCYSAATDAAGDLVGEFRITWSLKARRDK